MSTWRDSPFSPNFEFRVISPGKTWSWNGFGGELRVGQRIGVAWKKIEEPTPLAAGRYRVELVASRHNGYRTFRYSQLTGQSWYIKDLKWVAFKALER